jgi:hypothetical protein
MKTITFKKNSPKTKPTNFGDVLLAIKGEHGYVGYKVGFYDDSKEVKMWCVQHREGRTTFYSSSDIAFWSELPPLN